MLRKSREFRNLDLIVAFRSTLTDLKFRLTDSTMVRKWRRISWLKLTFASSSTSTRFTRWAHVSFTRPSPNANGACVCSDSNPLRNGMFCVVSHLTTNKLLTVFTIRRPKTLSSNTLGQQRDTFSSRFPSSSRKLEPSLPLRLERPSRRRRSKSRHELMDWVFLSEPKVRQVSLSVSPSAELTRLTSCADYISNRRLLLSLADAGGRLMLSWKDLSELAGSTSRVYTLLSTLHDLSSSRYIALPRPTDLEASKPFYDLGSINGKLQLTNVASEVEFEKVPIVAPAPGVARGGEELVHNLSFKIKAGEHLLIAGGNGTGKTAISRVLAGAHTFPVSAWGLKLLTLARYIRSLARLRGDRSSTWRCWNHVPTSTTLPLER